jgi:glycosyltransferase involved in cell wall biosynthesis/GT2 family glycosyltransferase
MMARRQLTDEKLSPGDYVSEGLSIVRPDAFFPNLVIGDKADHPGAYLHSDNGHHWYCDRRNPSAGSLTRDEAILLYNLALQFRNRPGLEVGGGMGWSTCHLGLAGLILDVLDPAFADAEHAAGVKHSLAAAGIVNHVRLYSTASPDGVRDLARMTSIKWNFFFIDGDQRAPAPLLDTRECLERAAPDAMIVFHDLASPDVEEGLNFLWQQGWQVLLYQTMHIMGAAWRGNVKPVKHKSDPAITWTLPLHLVKYPVSGYTPDEEIQRLSHGIASRNREIERLQQELSSVQTTSVTRPDPARNDQVLRLQENLAAQQIRYETVISQLARLKMAMFAAEADLMVFKNELKLANQQARRAEDNIAEDGAAKRREELSRLQAALTASDTENRCLVQNLANASSEVERLRTDLETQRFWLGELQSSASWKLTAPLRELKKTALSILRLPGRVAQILSTEMNALPPKAGFLVRTRETDSAIVRAGEKQFPTPRHNVNAWGKHPLFDASFYLDANPDVAQAGIDPLLHYIERGAGEGRDPHPLFDTSFYLERNPDVAEAGVNPLFHYMDHGGFEGRDPHPLFDTSFYCDNTPDVLQARINPLFHFLSRGGFEGHDPHPLFDTSFYLEKNPDVAEAGLNPLFHYMDHGGFEGRDPHPLFDTSFYCDNNPDVLKARTNPLFHFLSRDGFEAGDPHPLFSVSFYFRSNPDIMRAGINPLVHFVVHGAREERDPHPLFDTSFYLEQKPHVRGLKINPLVHFLGEGPTPEFDVSPTEPMPDVGICIVTPDIVGPVKNGGIGTSCYHYLRILQRAGHAVSVFYTGDLTDCQKAHWRNVYQKFGIKFIALSDAPPVTHPVYASNWFLERSWRTYEYLRHTRYSVIHFQDWHANGFWSIKAKQVGCAFEETLLTVITQASTRWINEGMQQFGANAIETAKLVWAETYCMERCDLLISPSQHMIQWAKNNKITLPRRTMLAPYVWADPTETSRPGHVDNDHIIFFGRLETRKGLHIFGQALLELRQKSGNLPKVVSFIGKHANVLGRLSSEFIEDLRVALPSVEIRVINDFDYRQSLEYIKATRGLVVLPSILDNYPLTVLECIQSGLPFIAASTGGIPEMIDERVCFEPNATALAECLQNRQLIDFGNLQHKYSAGAAAKTWLDLHADVGSPNFQTEARQPVQSEVRPQMVSICIPFFNHPTYLESLIASVAFQTYPAFEVILVNDGSNAEASAKFDRVARRCRDSRFHFFTTENAGPGAARNFAASKASGNMLVFFDADNIPKSDNFIHDLVSALEHSGADCLTCPFDIVAGDKIHVTDEDVIATYRPFGPCIEAGFFENVLGDATMIMTRAVFKALGGFPTGRASWEDHEFLLRLCFNGFKLETFTEAIFYYRQSPQGRNKQANDYQNYQSLFSALQSASPEDLARIITAVGGPMLVGRPGTPSAKLASG